MHLCQEGLYIGFFLDIHVLCFPLIDFIISSIVLFIVSSELLVLIHYEEQDRRLVIIDQIKLSSSIIDLCVDSKRNEIHLSINQYPSYVVYGLHEGKFVESQNPAVRLIADTVSTEGRFFLDFL
jgi:hypothetical protein